MQPTPQQAYYALLQALLASEKMDWDAEEFLGHLRTELKVSNEEHSSMLDQLQQGGPNAWYSGAKNAWGAFRRPQPDYGQQHALPQSRQMHGHGHSSGAATSVVHSPAAVKHRGRPPGRPKAHVEAPALMMKEESPRGLPRMVEEPSISGYSGKGKAPARRKQAPLALEAPPAASAPPPPPRPVPPGGKRAITSPLMSGAPSASAGEEDDSAADMAGSELADVVRRFVALTRRELQIASEIKNLGRNGLDDPGDEEEISLRMRLASFATDELAIVQELEQLEAVAG